MNKHKQPNKFISYINQRLKTISPYMPACLRYERNGTYAFLCLSVLAAIAGIILCWIIFGGIGIFATITGAIAGFSCPFIWLENRYKDYKLKLERDLPDMVEMLAFIMDSGLNLKSALEVYLKAHQFVLQNKPVTPLIVELTKIVNLIEMGSVQNQDMHPAISRIFSMIIQNLQFGTPMSMMLKEEAEMLKYERTQKLEQIAQEASIKLLFPLVLFIFPAIFIILLGPIFLQLKNGGF